ncbi:MULTISPECIES: FHA domain-containing protein [Nostoc]|uniref:FHA domain-containing protein n=2 Tax=Nostoc TaxID=1177 RepID=A0ABR8IEX0_9NOSO|nr:MULTISPECIES: FHA domain-containing protein [Nostoc]MBD2563405.1 FHA domain-containing protein [Nostoc linckia FACHB-391]MBD2649005.1 FHA domain-containing protein [Nostoc foliaceum FACHB-393]
MADFAQTEIERRLTLYQVFLKLYEHHSSLLDEILQLENLSQPSLRRVKVCYVHGVVDSAAVYLMTNLCDNQTQSLRQPQQIWTIGRNRSSGICIPDSYMSRRHAAIQYIDDQGFYFIDFKSTNGSFVNGDRAEKPIKLKDGDRIRLGSMTFDFFMNYTCRVLPTVAMELLMQLVHRKSDNQVEILTYPHDRPKPLFEKPDDNSEIFKNSGLVEKFEHWYDNFSSEQKSEILDRFFSRQIPYNPS